MFKLVYSTRNNCIATLLLLLICDGVHGQFKVLEDNSARIFIVGGGRVDFSFNSINKWQTGITYDDFTTFGIQYVDSAGIGTWELMFRANDGNGNGSIDGDNGNLIEFNKVGVRVNNAAGLGASTFCPTFKALLAVDQILARGNVGDCGLPAPGTPCLGSARRLFIDWTFGVASAVTFTVLGETPDHYVEDIIFTLQPTTGVPMLCP